MSPRGLATAACAGLLTASSLGLASGCSTSDQVSEQLNKAQYVAQINALLRQLKDEAKLGKQLINSGSLAEAGPILKQAAAKFDQIVNRLRAIDPPAAIRSVHDQLTNALVHFRDVVATTRQALENGDLGALLTGGQELLAFPQQLNAVVADYNAQGYAIQRP
ncbi:MAG: hypothetical protein ACXWEA_04645 [Solirubrobacterales bacterium]